MSKPEQVLTIEPASELKFLGPFNVPITSYMKLTNPSERRVLFKIKTTAPKKYCVRPNSGILEPKNSLEIAICLQPFIFDPAEKNKHKFMVQTVFAPEGDVNLDALWKEISPEMLMDSKLKCVFELPDDGVTNAAPMENEVIMTADKIKREVKSSPKISSGSPLIDAELQKATTEITQLRELESTLRQENLQLKEEILRLRHAVGEQPKTPMTLKYTPSPRADNFLLVYLGGAVIIAIFGIIVGKLIL